MDAIYTLEGIQKQYAGRAVLQLDRLDVQRGEFLALVGPSGAGKSTLLRLLNFLELPDQGEILFEKTPAGPGM
ncbi:MAG: ATP-binding cassette domain-containing protein, partial [Anaerolineae bacterium]|nr:ATP-binding cassette domain-containing protein [Anaerolineae bacterium]